MTTPGKNKSNEIFRAAQMRLTSALYTDDCKVTLLAVKLHLIGMAIVPKESANMERFHMISRRLEGSHVETSPRWLVVGVSAMVK